MNIFSTQKRISFDSVFGFSACRNIFGFSVSARFRFFSRPKPFRFFGFGSVFVRPDENFQFRFGSRSSRLKIFAESVPLTLSDSQNVERAQRAACKVKLMKATTNLKFCHIPYFNYFLHSTLILSSGMD